jgi:carbon monoxide dehydrogenase subunit G
MDLEHSFIIPVPPEQAWQALLDVEQVAPCMPGATVDGFDGENISGKIKIKVGPVQMTYAGTAHFTEKDEATKTVVLEASGKETRGSGTASATIRSSLRDENGQTRVLVRTTMTVTGRPAQFGRGVMAEVGGRIIGKFAANLAAQLSGEGAAASAEAPGTPATSSGAASTPTAGSANASTPNASAPTASTGAAAAAAASTSDEGGVNGLAADAAQLPIEELNLPVRSFNSLRREGVHTVGGLAARTEKELLAIDGLGPQSIKEIKSRLADHGLALTTPGVTADEGADAGVAASTASPGAATSGASGGASGAAPADPTPAVATPAGSTPAGTASAGPTPAATAPSGTAPSGAAPGAGATGTGGAQPSVVGSAVGPDATGTWDAGAAPTDRSAANGLLPPRGARPQDEDALDLLSVAGLPLLKRVAPVAGFLLIATVVFRIVRRRRRASRV